MVEVGVAAVGSRAPRARDGDPVDARRSDRPWDSQWQQAPLPARHDGESSVRPPSWAGPPRRP
eukprot:6917822-Alexandrium_andersonii.AAC.1